MQGDDSVVFIVAEPAAVVVAVKMLQPLPMLHVVLLLSRLRLDLGGGGVLVADGRGAGGTTARQA